VIVISAGSSVGTRDETAAAVSRIVPEDATGLDAGAEVDVTLYG
jgi:molybdopterin biosynthesis enzyme